MKTFKYFIGKIKHFIGKIKQHTIDYAYFWIYLRKYIYDRLDFKKITKQNNTFFEYGTFEIVEDKPPILSQKRSSFDKVFYAKDFSLEKPFVGIVENVDLVGRFNTAFSSNKKVILENSVARLDCLRLSIRIEDIFLDKIYNRSSREQLEYGINLVNIWSDNYFHWILEGLTRLEIYDILSEKYNANISIILSDTTPSYVNESLQILDLDKFVFRGHWIHVNKLIVPSFRRQDGRTSPSACRWLRESFIKKLKILDSSFGDKKIYVSRRKATSRRVLNEDNLLAILQDYGFESYVLEDMNLEQQIRLFSMAEIVVAPHGAGLTNIVFSANPNLLVVELFRDDYVNPCYWHLANSFGFNYAPIFAETLKRDMKVPVDIVRRLVEKQLNVG